jgi:hypothetical protein
MKTSWQSEPAVLYVGGPIFLKVISPPRPLSGRF